MTMADESYEEGVIIRHSAPGLKRNQLTRAAKKLMMEFDAQYSSMSRAERDEFLERIFPEPAEVTEEWTKIISSRV